MHCCKQIRIRLIFLICILARDSILFACKCSVTDARPRSFLTHETLLSRPAKGSCLWFYRSMLHFQTPYFTLDRHNYHEIEQKSGVLGLGNTCSSLLQDLIAGIYIVNIFRCNINCSNVTCSCSVSTTLFSSLFFRGHMSAIFLISHICSLEQVLIHLILFGLNHIHHDYLTWANNIYLIMRLNWFASFLQW